MATTRAALRRPIARPAKAARRKFLGFFPAGFRDETYEAWERDYKWDAHQRWEAALGRETFRSLLDAGQYQEIARRALRVESKTNLLFSFEKMALRDAVSSEAGARAFAEGLYAWLHGAGRAEEKFPRWAEVVAALPREQTRVNTWPIVTVFGFLARPEEHLYLKPRVTQAAAEAYGFDFQYRPGPQWETYRSLLDFAETVRADLADLEPRDMIDLQSFIWVAGSPEYD
jgi:hypothetical protein